MEESDAEWLSHPRGRQTSYAAGSSSAPSTPRAPSAKPPNKRPTLPQAAPLPAPVLSGTRNGQHEAGYADVGASQPLEEPADAAGTDWDQETQETEWLPAATQPDKGLPPPATPAQPSLTWQERQHRLYECWVRLMPCLRTELTQRAPLLQQYRAEQ